MGNESAYRTPALYWDGDCGFCRGWVERWRDATGDRVRYEPVQSAAPRIVAAAGGDPPQHIVLEQPDDSLLTGAHAALAALAVAGGAARFLLSVYLAVPPFRWASEFCYRQVAAHRELCARLTRLLWGGSVRAPTYEISGWIFPRTAGLVFFCAFLSLWAQIDGLAGSRGILPVAEQLAAVRAEHGPSAIAQMPSLLWLGAGDASLHFWLAVGAAASLALAAGLAPAASAFAVWLCYLTFAAAIPVFMDFQWDALLLETALLVVFYVPWRGRLERGACAPPRLGRLLVWWLLFRLMFESGAVKLRGFDAAGRNAWLDGTALDFHYFTQPIPAWTSWWAAQLPHRFQAACIAAVFFIQLVLPLAIVGPRRLRMTAFWGFVGLMILILLSGNYGFFNLLALALCVSLVDDASWPAPLRRLLGNSGAARPPGPAQKLQRLVLPWFASAALFATTLQLLLVLHAVPAERAIPLLRPILPLRSANSYGLFSVMTTERPEITVETSTDGRTWVPVAFRYKMSADDNALPLFPPHMPRLDWQMWFAALEFRTSGRLPGWIGPFLARLQEQSPLVLRLIENTDPPGPAPRFFRIKLDLLDFTRLGAAEARTRTWQARPLSEYTIEGSLRP